jgi:membrane fusion protein, copper/silver efflux system
MMRIVLLHLAGALALLACAVHPSSGESTHGAEHTAAASAALSSSDPHAGHAGHVGHAESVPAGSGDAGGLPPGYAPVTINPARTGGLGLVTTKVEEREFTRTIRTAGVVTVDETRTSHVHAKVRGWIDGVRANFIGRKVVGGETLCSIYSQEVFAAELEFLALLDRTGKVPATQGDFAQAEARAQAQLLDAARRRLSLWDVPKAEIQRLERTREPQRTFALAAPRPGIIVAKQAVEGMYVEPSLELYLLSDLSRLWVLADVYDRDLPYVHVGDHGHLTVEGVPEPLHAAVTFVPRSIDEATRTLKIRFELDNKDDRLRPGALVSVVMNLKLGKGLSVPESAVIRTGTRSIVFVVHDRVHAEPREVRLGPLAGDRYQVDAGLEAGDEVATSAQFLLDSESRLRATSSPHGGHVH